MPYIGHNPTNAGSFIFLDDVASGFNNSETDFTLQVGGVSVTPNTQNLLIALDGVIQQAPDAYTVSGSTISFTAAVPSGTDFYGILMGQSASIGLGTIGADELKISGNGTNGQLIKTDGDGTFSYINQNTVTASTAATLATARTINGVSFDGSGNITVTADANTLSNTTLKSTVVSSSLTSVGTLSSLTTSGNVGIGMSPDMPLNVKVATNEVLRVRSDSGVQLTARNEANSSDVAMLLRASSFTFQQGNVTISNDLGIGAAPRQYYSLDVYQSDNSAIFGLRSNANACTIYTQTGNDVTGQMEFSTSQGWITTRTASPLKLGINNVPKVTIGADGHTTFAGRITLSNDGSDNGLFMGGGWQIFDNASEAHGTTGDLIFYHGASRIRMADDGGFKIKQGTAGSIAKGFSIENAGDTNLAAAIFEENTNPTTGELRLYSGGSEKVYLRASSNSSHAFWFKGGQMQDITANNTGIQYRANWDTGFLNRIDNNFDGASAASSYMRFKVASGAGSQNTALTLKGDGTIAVSADTSAYAAVIQNNQGDGAVLDLYASTSDDHAFDPIFKVRTDAQDLFMIDNKGNWYSGDNFTSNPWDSSSGEGGLYFQTGYNNSGQTFAIANNQDRGYAVIYCNAINADASDGRHIQWMNDGTPAGHIHFNSANSVAYNTSQSDKTLKKNFANWTENVLDSFDKINPQLFHFKIQKDSEEKVKGFIAQEMVDKFPEAYPMGAYGEGDDKETKYHFNPSGMVVYLMKAVKELSDKIKVLEAK